MKILLEVSAVGHVIVITSFLFNLQGVSNVTGQLDYMDLNLGEDVAKPTQASCEFKKRSVRSLNGSSQERTAAGRNSSDDTVSSTVDNDTSDFVDDCLVWPRKLKFLGYKRRRLFTMLAATRNIHHI